VIVYCAIASPVANTYQNMGVANVLAPPPKPVSLIVSEKTNGATGGCPE
jgi:hypothetical protein